jgi:hypothetical protein
MVDRYIFYQLRKPQVLDLVKAATGIAGFLSIEMQTFDQFTQLRKYSCLDCKGNLKDHPYTSGGNHLVG